MKPLFALAVCALAATLLSGCEDTRKALGFEKATPDEFRVVSHPPLSLPPEYGLRPPRPGEARPQETPAVERAQKALTGQAGSNVKERSAGENALLNQAGAPQISPTIREDIAAEESKNAPNDPTLWNKLKSGTLIFDKKEKNPSVLDPEQEHKRLLELKSVTMPSDSTAEGEAVQDPNSKDIIVP